MEFEYEEEEELLPEELPIIAMIDGITIYPHMPPMPHFMPPYLSLPSGRAAAAVEEAMDNESRLVCLFQQKTDKKRELQVKDFNEIGTLINIMRFRKEDEGVWMMVQGASRVRLLELTQQQPFFKGKIEIIDEEEYESVDVNVEALMRNVLELFKNIVNLSPRLHEDFAIIASGIEDAGHLADFIASITELKSEDKQALLQTIDPKERLERLTVMLNKELDLLELGSKIQSEAQAEIDKDQRTYFLRERLKAIQKELGEAGEISTEVEEIRTQIAEAKMSQEAQKAAEKELSRLEKMHPSSAEYTVSRTYLDWLVTLPWSKSTQDNLDIKRAQKILDEDHYDLTKVKDRILEYLAVRKLKTDMKGPILCFVGPPGVGKTSLGRSIARALGRKFVRISLGGVRDEAEIRGHRRTYIGSLPGRIIQSLRQIGSNNPVFMLDEVDKIGTDFRGDPAAALLEALDPEQNHAFSDHYLDVTFDLSKVMFITTANLLDPIPPALLDRMEVLELPGYTAEEKLMIAKQFLIPKQLKEHGISKGQLRITDGGVKVIIGEYTKEAGVRNLEREIGSICRKTARRVAEGEKGMNRVTARNISEYLGPFKFYSEVAEVEGEVGVATALAATATGGEILFVEATQMPGKGELTLTGQLGAIMKESAQAALSFIRSRSEKLNIAQDFFVKNDFHIHVPAGATPKDGPSAGITIATALASLAMGRSVVPLIAMTGEITLRGRVLPVGGLKEKILAAKRAGIETIIIPKRNQKDLVEVPDEAKKGMKFIFVDNADQVLNVALN
ncbi:TPA: endopeptidase La [Candidatus Poribacteria bacterium]|nr:endopeptidase La [Candidatus Poribacteria bacterium]